MRQTTEIGHLLDERPLSALQIRVVVLCSLVVLFDGYDIQTMALAVPSIAAEWSMPSSAFGLALTAALIGMGVGAAFFAPLGDKWGRRPITIGFLAVVGGASLGTALANDLFDFVLWRFLTGVGLGVSLANATALTSEFLPARRRSALITLMFCNVAVGAFLAGFTAPTIIDAFGWRGIFVAGGVAPLVLSVVLWLGAAESVRFLVAKRPNDPRIGSVLAKIAPDVDPRAVFAAPSERVRRQSVLELVSPTYRARTFLLWCTFSLNLFVLYLLISWLPTLLTDAGWSRSSALKGAVMIQIGGVTGGLLLAWLADRGKPVGALLIAYSLAALALGSFLFVPSDVTAWSALILLLGGGISGAQLVLYALAVAFYPPMIRATGLGWAAAVSRVGAISAPLVGGWVVQQGIGAVGVLGMLIVPTVLCALSVLLLPRVLR